MCDLPAKALFLNKHQYNHKFGCQVSKDSGEYEEIARIRIYPYKDVLHLRTTLETENHASSALETKMPVCGVKGPTIRSKIAYDCRRSTSVDVVHCVFEGCVK